MLRNTFRVTCNYEDIEEKTYNLSSSSTSYFLTYSASGSSIAEEYSSSFNGGAAVLSISNLDRTNKTISGTFSGVLSKYNGETVGIADGSFTKIPYTE